MPLVLLLGLGLAVLVGAPIVGIMALFHSLRVPCPCDGCRGHMVHDHDEVRDGVTMSIWQCSACAEVEMHEVPSSQPHTA